MAKILLINPPSSFSVYSKSSIRAVIPVLPPMSLAMLAASLIAKNHEVKVLDMAVEKDPASALTKILDEFQPSYAGLTSTTPLFSEVSAISRFIRERCSGITIVGGGAHISACPADSLKASEIDIAVVGEGENALLAIVSGQVKSDIGGIWYKEADGIKSTPARTQFPDLNDLPFPRFDMFPLEHYHFSDVISRKSPVAPMELTRGCPFNCSFCNKNIMGKKFRVKSPERVLEELRYFKKLGFKEIHVIDDQFTSNLNNAKTVFDRILSEGLQFSWNFRTGVRVDCVDMEFLKMAKRAGCYQVGVGFESGSQEILDSVHKGIKVEDSLRAVGMIKSAGIECVGFYMLGFLNDTEQTMRETIDFAIKVNADYAKATIVTPFPGTELFAEYEKLGLIKSYDWSKYNFHTVSEVYDHPSLSWKTLKHYYSMFHRKYYLRPGYVIPRALSGLRTGRIFRDAYHGLKTFTRI